MRRYRIESGGIDGMEKISAKRIDACRKRRSIKSYSGHLVFRFVAYRNAASYLDSYTFKSLEGERQLVRPR